VIALVENHKKELEVLCRRYRVRRLELFGSAATGEFRSEQSDLDFLVEFDSPTTAGYADRYFGMLESIEALFERPVDLVVAAAIRNPYFRAAVDRTKVLLYAA
jgi:uncharacterized protein